MYVHLCVPLGVCLFFCVRVCVCVCVCVCVLTVLTALVCITVSLSYLFCISVSQYFFSLLLRRSARYHNYIVLAILCNFEYLNELAYNELMIFCSSLLCYLQY